MAVSSGNDSNKLGATQIEAHITTNAIYLCNLYRSVASQLKISNKRSYVKNV